MKLVKILSLILPLGASAIPSLAQDLDTTRFDQLTAVHITGEGSRTVITADPDRMPEINVHKTSASSLLCNMTADLSQQDDVLIIDVHQEGFSLGLRCDLTVEIVVPQAVAVNIDQPQAVVEMKGEFKNIDVNVEELTVEFDGHATQFNVKSEMAVIDAIFANSKNAGSQIDIDVDKLVANIGYIEGAGLDYTVSAPVSMFSQHYPNTSGAAGTLRIKSKLLKGTLYPVADPT